MGKYFGYIRVSTARQGEHGVSLQEQRDAIARYAQHHNLYIISWFEERETAAKQGRPVFSRMLKMLGRGQATGVIIHKIDRSARNLKDWSDLGAMIDRGIEVHFANESLDLNSRGGRLSADIQAVVAADFIRNLREETRKGLNGRLKQGIYPFPAPLGYLNCGSGKPKAPDPVIGPLIRQAFELYASGQYSLETLAKTLHMRGLCTRQGRKISETSLSQLMSNPFYLGLIRLKRSGQLLPGIHRPLVSKALFERVQAVMHGKTQTKLRCHDLLFRQLLKCKNCGYLLNGEIQKGHVYYRCHSKPCAGTSLREEQVDARVQDLLRPLQFGEKDLLLIRQQITRMQEEWQDRGQEQAITLKLKIGQLSDRLNRLTDAYLDGAIEQDLFTERKAALLLERKGLEDHLTMVGQKDGQLPEMLAEFLELAGNLYLSYILGTSEEKRELLKIATSNRAVAGKNVELELSFPFQQVADYNFFLLGSPERSTTRTLSKFLKQLGTWIHSEQASMFIDVFRKIRDKKLHPPRPEPDSSIDDEEDDYQWVKIAG